MKSFPGLAKVGRLLLQSIVIAILVLPGGTVYSAEKKPQIIVYKSPTCSCCNAWITHLESNGFDVIKQNRNDMPVVKGEMGVLPQFQSCHTGYINGYYIEGHVPADDIKRFLKEKPKAVGLSVPGMPVGSPGMEGPRKDPYSVLQVNKDGSVKEFSKH